MNRMPLFKLKVTWKYAYSPFNIISPLFFTFSQFALVQWIQLMDFQLSKLYFSFTKPCRISSYLQIHLLYILGLSVCLFVCLLTIKVPIFLWDLTWPQGRFMNRKNWKKSWKIVGTSFLKMRQTEKKILQYLKIIRPNFRATVKS